ncbi:MAG: S8 family serine peptidase, partial [Planctomycetota bacterium]
MKGIFCSEHSGRGFSLRPFYVSLFRRLVAVILAVSYCFVGNCSAAADENIINLADPRIRQQVVEQLETQSQLKKAQAWQIAQTQGWAPKTSVGHTLYELMAIEDGRVYMYKTCNVNAAISIAADLVRNISPYDVNGLDWTIGIWDGGAVCPTHQEFGSRVTIKDGASQRDHSTHVGGTIGAAGVVASALGMAPEILIDSYEWTSDESEMTSRAETGSWSGYYGPHWFGTWGWGYREADYFGIYESGVVQWDQLCYNAPYFLPFKAVGNDRDNTAPADGYTFWYIWKIVGPNVIWKSKSYDGSSDPYDDGYDNGGFDTIMTISGAKNIMTVGAVNDAVSGGIRDPNYGTMSVFSGWGPTDDGRIKPDIVTNGVSLYSSIAGSDSSYAWYSGTSMATPGAAGAAMLLVDYYGRLFPGQFMRASTIKALIIHTADDLGNAGPDYKFGWGLMNTEAAAEKIKDHNDFPDANNITEGLLNGSNTQDTYSLEWNNSGPIKATICWTDPPGSAVTGLDNPSPRLKNDLDLRIYDPNGWTYYPFVLNLSSPADVADTNDNIRDNVEQVLISSPSITGTYTVEVSYKGTLTNGQQYYSLILSGQSESKPEINIKQDSNDIPDGGSFDFGSVRLGQAKSVQFTIENTGSAQLDLSGSPKVQITGSDANSFTVTQQPSSPVDPNNSTTFEIRFAPADSQGQYTAAVNIANNDVDENPYNFDVNGFGLFPAIVYVDDDANGFVDGSQQYPFDTINAGINAAFDGSIVLVQPGIYYETIDLNDTDPNVITIKSSDPNDPNIIASTIIDANGLGTS